MQTPALMQPETITPQKASGKALTLILLVLVVLLFAAGAPAAAPAQDVPANDLELSRPVRAWEFLPAVGTRAGLFGQESGAFEAWVYPLKIFREFRLQFRIADRVLPAEALARTLTVHPESSTITYVYDTFQVKETVFVPVNEPGAVVLVEVETAEPLQIEAEFVRDFTLEWPAALGATYMSWDAALRAFVMAEEQRKYVALVGSPSAVVLEQEYATNYSSSAISSFSLGQINKGRDKKVIIIAGSMTGRAAAEKTFQHLAADYNALLRDSADYYRRYLDHTITLALPDSRMQQAYDWARVSMLQGVVANPYLGTGLVAGYRGSDGGQRPGFAWFFGRDTEWTALALDAAGDFVHVRQGLEFLAQYQRADGKIPHEIAQTASLVDWFKSFPYPWASADATPLFIIAVRDYVLHSGDVAFATQKWENIQRAYQFLRSTWDPQGLAQNFGIGHGWVEGGPLRPPDEANTNPGGQDMSSGQPKPRVIKTELYQSGLGIEALGALADLARVAGHNDVRGEAEQAVEHQRQLLNKLFWNQNTKTFAFALDPKDQRIDVPSVLATVPMWFGLLDMDKAQPMINQLADADFETDWGSRIISSRDPRYDPAGYHYGTVWPLFTGWAAVGEYRYHRPLAAYANLRANAELALDGSLGHVTEVLSGDYYQSLSTSSPHQIWSAAMVVSPLLRGLMGMEVNVPAHQFTFAPHVPAEWNSFRVGNVRVGSVTIDLAYSRADDEIKLEARSAGKGECILQFAPAVSLHARVLDVEMNGRPAAFHLQANTEDQHIQIRVPILPGLNTIRIRMQGDFNLGVIAPLPRLGLTSRNLKFVSQSWSADRQRLQLEVSGLSGREYQIPVFGSALFDVQGARVNKDREGFKSIQLRMPEAVSPRYLHTSITIRFSAGKPNAH